MDLIESFKNYISSSFSSKSADDSNSLSIYTPERNFTGLSMSSRKRIDTTDAAYRAHELVFACINKIADVMNDAEIIVEKKNKDDEWERVPGHLLSALFKRPNGFETGKDFRRLMVQSEQSKGIVYIELVRSNAGLVVEAAILNPNRVQPRLNRDRTGVAYYEVTNAAGYKRQILPENMLIRRRVDLLDRFFGLAPLSVALKTVNSDVGLTDYIDAFFENDGTPSGILKILKASLPDIKKEELSTKWRMKYGRGGSNQKSIAVLDQDAEYQKIGANLDELAADSLSDRFESRACSPFGVPPILVGALVGLKHTTANATMKSALRDFWDNKISPELASLREWLTWFLLPEFEDINLIKAERVRVGFDISQAAFLQEDIDKLHKRAQDNVKAGIWTVNEGRMLTGVAPDPEGDYYLQPSNTAPQSPEIRAETAVEKIPQGKPADTQMPADETAPKQLSAPVEKKTKKSVEYDGMILGREPRGVELVINLKTLINDFENERQKAANILTKFRNELIDAAAAAIDELSVETVYQLTLSPNQKTRKQIEKVLRSAYERGRAQIVDELNAQKTAKNSSFLNIVETKDLNDDDEIVDLTDITISKIINEIQSRAINWYVSLKTLGSYSLELLKEKLSGESLKFVEQQAGNSVNASIRIGRVDSILETSELWHTLEYSAVLDANTCSPCEDADGQTGASVDDLPDAPNPDCDGRDRCRCFVIAIAD